MLDLRSASAANPNDAQLTSKVAPRARKPPTVVTLPLEPASGGTFCVRVTTFASNDLGVDNRSFRVHRAIVDTGSPYLVLPYSGPESGSIVSRATRWMGRSAFASARDGMGMEDMPLELSKSEYENTEEVYGAVKGQIDWKMADYSFRDTRLRIRQNDKAVVTRLNGADTMGVVGVLDDALTKEATGGGAMEPYALLGLIRDSNPNADRDRFPDPRPSFLEQECIAAEYGDGAPSTNEEYYPIKSFCIDGPMRELTLSTQSLIPRGSTNMSLFDLRTYGDFVDHYAVMVDSISFDGGIPLTTRILRDFTGSSIDRPIVAVFDTGLSGCLLIRPFWNVLRDYMGSKRQSVDELKSVSLALKGSGNGIRKDGKKKNGESSCSINSSVDDSKRFYVQPIDLDWFDDSDSSPYVIVLGQTFLDRGALTIDIDERIASFNLGGALLGYLFILSFRVMLILVARTQPNATTTITMKS